jgi:hypothetical protein
MKTNDNNEASDSYDKVIAKDAQHRVIMCRDNIQWIIQRKQSDRWRSESYCTTRTALIREWTYRVPDMFQLPPEISGLPDSI